jgi:DNA repair protein RadC
MITKRNQIPGVADVDVPWEKLQRVGLEALRDEELLAIMIRTGYEGRNVLEISKAILHKNPIQTLMEMDVEGFTKIKGIGQAKATIIVAGFELARRGLNQGIGVEPCIGRPRDVVGLLTDIKDEKKEFFIALFLNARNQVIKKETISIGSLNASLVHPREVFSPAVGSSAASVILAHNHPSGDVTPSREDVELTKRMVQAGELMGIEVLDHLVVASERFLSMKEANLF